MTKPRQSTTAEHQRWSEDNGTVRACHRADGPNWETSAERRLRIRRTYGF